MESNRIDGRGVAFSTTYDYLSRVTARTAGSEQITYGYGTSGTGAMRLVQETNGSMTKSYAYDTYGRTTTITHMGNATTYSYTTDGLVSTIGRPGSKTDTYTYDSYGNVTGLSAVSGAMMWSKTGIGSYEYGTSSKPHAVTAVDNTSGIIPEHTQSVTYNAWGKVSEISYVSGGDTYQYTITYGPDLERWFTYFKKNGVTQYYTYYGVGYENCYHQEPGTTAYTLRTYYVNTPDDLSGIVRYDSRTSSYTPYAVETDHLGSITALYNSSGTKVLAATYDAWGKRTQTTGTLEFRRGYTGHEHIDGFDLINMNGRVYDPLIGRFLSPDPFVQMPDFSQSFNRYSYCLNNPLKYTDPDGELFGTLLGVISDVFKNYYIEKRQLKDWDWSRTKMGWELDKGMFITDSNKSKGAQVWEFISRLTWQLPQTMTGDLFVSSANAIGKVYGVTYGYGMTAVDMGLDDAAVTIGFYTAGPRGYKADWKDHLFVHEYGHYIQSQQHGPAYLLTVGVPSLQSDILDTKSSNAPNHKMRWFEADASYKGAEYFDKYYGSGKDDYKPDSPDFFDRESFVNGTESKYINSRKGNNNGTVKHPISGDYHWTDIMIYIPVLGLIPWFWY